jgi:hypothetical protein
MLYLAFSDNVLKENKTRKIKSENDENETLCHYAVQYKDPDK